METSNGTKLNARTVSLSKEILKICLEEIEWEIRFKYCGRMPTKRSRIGAFIKKHIAALRNRDALFEQYHQVSTLLGLECKSDFIALQIVG